MYETLVKLSISLGATLGVYGLYATIGFFYRQWTSHLMTLPGPPRANLLWGNMKQIMEPVRDAQNGVSYLISLISGTGKPTGSRVVASEVWEDNQTGGHVWGILARNLCLLIH